MYLIRKRFTDGPMKGSTALDVTQVNFPRGLHMEPHYGSSFIVEDISEEWVVDLFEDGDQCVVTLATASGSEYYSWSGAIARGHFAAGSFVRGVGFEASVILWAAQHSR